MIAIKCSHCKRAISAGVDAQKMIVEYKQADGSTKVFGYMTPNGPLLAATGQLLRGWHFKCYHIERKRESRGNAVTGRAALGAVPTGYAVSDAVLGRDEFLALGISVEEARERTAGITERADKLREVAHRIGKGVGDATVLEAFWAEEHGGPYEHSHHLRLEVYQLRAHLGYAHGHDLTQGGLSRPDVHLVHEELHAAAALAKTTTERQSDSGYAETPERDWREQLAVDVEDITPRAEPCN